MLIGFAAGAPPVSAAPSDGYRSAPRLTEQQVRDRARLEQSFEAILEARPSARLDVTYRGATADWLVRIVHPRVSRDLARAVVSDRSGALRLRFAMAIPDMPPRLTADEAERIATADDRVRAALRRAGHPKLSDTSTSANLVDGSVWEVDFRDRDEIVVRADVDDSDARVTGVWRGHQIYWKMARGIDSAFGGAINDPWIWWTLVIGFVLVMVQPLRLWSVQTLDVLVLVSFVLSHAWFEHGRIDLSVPLAMPPLVYLFLRSGWMYFRGFEPVARAGAAVHEGPWLMRQRWLHEWPPTWLLWGAAVFAAGLRYGVNYFDSNVIDVGYAGVAGADAILAGRSPYGGMPEDNPHGDTYGPVNYLLYVPAVAALGHSGGWDDLPAAHLFAVASDIACAALLCLIGWRWFSARAAALLLAGWMLYPYTGYALSSNVNDLAVAAFVLAALATLPHAWLRGVMVALAAGVKFVPLVLLSPLLHAGTRSPRRQAALVLCGASAVVLACAVFVGSYPDGASRFWDATFGFQYDRDSPFSIWGLYGWRTAQLVAQGALAVGLVVAAFRPWPRDLRQVAAGAAAALLGVQIVLQHWFYLYIPWFFAPLLVCLVASRESVTARVSALYSAR